MVCVDRADTQSSRGQSWDRDRQWLTSAASSLKLIEGELISNQRTIRLRDVVVEVRQRRREGGVCPERLFSGSGGSEQEQGAGPLREWLSWTHHVRCCHLMGRAHVPGCSELFLLPLDWVSDTTEGPLHHRPLGHWDTHMSWRHCALKWITVEKLEKRRRFFSPWCFRCHRGWWRHFDTWFFPSFRMHFL